MEHRYALIVGIDYYNDSTHFIPLPFAQADARALYELLIDPERGGWRPEDVIYLAGESATRDEIESQLRELCLVRTQQDDLVLFYFAGHAFLDPATQDGYLALHSTRADRPVTGLHIPTFVDHYLDEQISWDTATGQVVQTLTGPEGAVWTVDFSPDGRLLVSGSEDGSLRLWDVYQGRELQTISHRIEVYGVVFGVNGLLANSAEDGAVRVWRTEPVEG